MSVKNVQPYANGQRLTVNFGNLTTATYNGFTLKVEYGPPRDKKVPFPEWQKLLETQELKLTNTLRAGSWNPVSFVIAPATAQDVGYLEFSLETDNVALLDR